MDFGHDPLLNYPTAQSLQEDSGALMRQIAELQQKRQAINMQAQVSPTPLWDEIDKIEDSLTDTQKQYLLQNEEYAQSLQYVSKLVQDEVLRIVRPRIEATENGKQALNSHLALAKKLKKSLAKEEEQRNALLNDYLTNHSDMTYKDYLIMVNGQGQTKKGAKR